MLKIIKVLPLALLTLVPNYENEEKTVYIETLTTSGNTEYLQINPTYTVTKANSQGLTFKYSFTADGVLTDLGTSYVSKLDVVKAKAPPNKSNKIYTSTLGTYNEFICEIVPDDPTLDSETVILKRNQYGNKCVYYNEKHNDGGLSSGFITQSYNANPSKNITREDRIMFLNYEDNLIVSTYNYFDISILKFKYINARYKNPNGLFYFDFIDTFGLFEDLPLEPGTMYRRLPLECILDEDVCCFTLKDNLYYDTITHKVSTTYKEGYYPTRKLYFPSDNFDLLKKITCRIVMDIKGYTEFTMIGEFKITHEKKLFGDCEDSEYCIHSTEDFIENKREKEIEVNI